MRLGSTPHSLRGRNVVHSIDRRRMVNDPKIMLHSRLHAPATFCTPNSGRWCGGAAVHARQLLQTLLLIIMAFMQSSLIGAMVLRLHESDLADLAEYTRAYLAENVENMAIEPFAQRVHHKLATGSLELENISLLHFSSPEIRYRPSDPGLLYIDTDGGRAELHADWIFHSQFLRMLGLPLMGRANGQITGFTSDIAVETPLNGLRMHQCVARFDRFELQLSGSLAADVLHWFHRALAKAMQSRVEQAYCRIIEERLLPWLLEQLARLPKRLRMRFSKRIHFSQVLHSIRPGSGYVDLELRGGTTGGGRSITSSDNIEALLSSSTTPIVPCLIRSTSERIVSSKPLLWRHLNGTTSTFLTTTTPSTMAKTISESVIDEEIVDEGEDANGASQELSEEESPENIRKPEDFHSPLWNRGDTLRARLRQQHKAIFFRPTRPQEE